MKHSRTNINTPTALFGAVHTFLSALLRSPITRNGCVRSSTEFHRGCMER
jgi:hypothetical protein